VAKMTGPAGKIPVWRLDGACGKVAGDDIFLSFPKILKTAVLTFEKATPGLQIEGAIYIINPVHIPEHCIPTRKPRFKP
jgi:hypothetical protein